MGEHYILAKVDADGEVLELKETNNVGAKLIGIGPGPDLASWTFGPATACAGETITVSDKTRNQGNMPADPSTTYFYLSKNKKIDASDVLLGTRPVPALAPGAFDVGSIQVTLPNDLPLGTYFLVAEADGEHVVAEVLESFLEFIKITINCIPEVCEDGIDNDGDGQIDEGCVEICNDGKDNDGDGQIDENCPQEICTDGLDNDGDGQIDEGCVVTNPGTGTPGYWMNHPEAWPVETITIGGIVYSKADAIALMKQSVSDDKTLTLFAALVSAKLNLLIGNDGTCVGQTIVDADAWMAAHPAGSGVHAGTDGSPWREGEPLYLRLDDYNNGLLCAPSRG
jgi:hypothetical protein